MFYTIENANFTATINTVGAELASFKKKNGCEYIWQDNVGVWDRHTPLLFPICSRLKDGKYTYLGKEYNMAAHGFIRFVEFTLVEKSDTEITLSFVGNEETKKSYPFDFEVIAKYTLSGEGIKFDFTVKNTGSDTLPYMYGWHPGFALPTDNDADIADYSILFGEDIEELTYFPLQHETFVPDEGVPCFLSAGEFPLVEDFLDEAASVIVKGHNNKVTLCSEKSGHKLNIEWSDNMPAICIWKAPDTRAKYICIEPWSDLQSDGEREENFETRKMSRLDSGKEETYTITLKP